MVGGIEVRKKRVGAGTRGWAAVIKMKIKTTSISRLVVVPEELTNVSDLIFFCKETK